MDNIKKKIQELCPNGVEYKKIKDIFIRLKGTPITAGKMKEIENPDGEIRVFAGGKTVINAKEEDIPNANITRVPAVLVQSRGVIDFIYYDKPFTFKNEMWAYTADNEITVKYLYYVLKNNVEHFREAASGMGALPQISLGVTEDFEVPLPPLAAQREIVHVLDKFTLLSQELAAELAARRAQYEFYRDKLLSFSDLTKNGGGYVLSDSIRVCELEELLLSLKTGLNPRTNFKLNTNDSTQPYITGKDIYNNKINVSDRTDKITQSAVDLINKRACLNIGDILFASTGTGTVGRMAIIESYNFDWSISESIYAMKPNKELVEPRYLMYVLYSKSAVNQYTPKISKASVPHLKVADLMKVKLPIPSIKKQREIITVLDRFDDLCNNICKGLPAEIEARKKQYEYYRDELLTFKKIVAQ